MTESTVSRRDSLKTMAAMGAAGAAIALGATAMTAAPAQAAQPLMHDALSDLQAARGVLNNALHDKGGHRVKALALIDEAIGEVRAGIAAGWR